MPVGRPAKLNKDLFIENILECRDSIVKGTTITSKHDPIWVTLSRQLDHVITPVSLYTFVTCNKYNVPDKLMNRSPMIHHENEIIENSLDKTQSNTELTVANTTKHSLNDSARTFTITIPKEEFTSMIMCKTYRRRKKGKSQSVREYTILRSGIWQHKFNVKIWEATKISCGFKFKNHKLSRNGEQGYANGTCKCGAIIKCDIDNSSSNNLTTKISCTFIQGHGQCGKRYLRRPIRDAIAEKLKKTTAMAYRIQMAEDLMNESDTVEPSHLFSANVLRTAKNKIAEEDYLDKDPLKSLLLM